jgi:hypothetical protein
MAKNTKATKNSKISARIEVREFRRMAGLRRPVR